LSEGDQSRDRVWIERVAAGDREAYSALYDRYASVMFGAALRLLRERREAEDLLHDVFLEVWRKAGDYDPARGSVRTWLLVRLRSRALDRRKSVYHTRVVALEERALEREEAPLGDPSMDLEREAVRRALRQLPEAQQAVLELAYYQGFSSSEIAARLGIPLGTVKSRVAGGMARLREALSATQEGAA
jgi:RNA polymerase sigma-70 factor (ECF subfamily)